MTKTLFDPIVGFQRPIAIGIGKVFYVSGAGNNNNNGINPATPFATITYALTQCADGRGDYIFILSTTTEPAYPIDVTISDVHFIGIGNPSSFGKKIHVFGGGQRCFEITTADGHDLEWAGIGFGTDTDDAIWQENVPPRGWVHHCAFGGSPQFDSNPLRSGITGGQMSQWVIEDNVFGSSGESWGTLSGYGIHGDGGLVNILIRRNMFFNCLLGAIRSSGANMEIGAILDNKIYVGIAQAPVAGWGIYIAGVGATYGAWIDGNHAGQTGDSTVDSNPYRDVTGGALNLNTGWGLNYVNDTPQDPAFA